MQDEQRAQWFSFAKFVIGTVLVGGLTTYINSQIQTREIDLNEVMHTQQLALNSEVHKNELAIKEMEQLGLLFEKAFFGDVDQRRWFAKYMQTISKDDKVKDRWKDWYDLISREHLEQLESDHADLMLALEKMVAKDDADQRELSALERRLSKNEIALKRYKDRGMEFSVSVDVDGTLQFHGGWNTDAWIIEGDDHCTDGWAYNEEATVKCDLTKPFTVGVRADFR